MDPRLDLLMLLLLCGCSRRYRLSPLKETYGIVDDTQRCSLADPRNDSVELPPALAFTILSTPIIHPCRRGSTPPRTVTWCSLTA